MTGRCSEPVGDRYRELGAPHLRRAVHEASEVVGHDLLADRALERGDGFVNVLVGDEVLGFSRHLHCVDCSIDLPELEPRLFSFNSPRGACPDCDGLGMRQSVDPDKIVVDPSKSIRDGALSVVTRGGHLTYTRVRVDELAALVPVDKAWKTLTERQQNLVLYGAPRARVKRNTPRV